MKKRAHESQTRRHICGISADRNCGRVHGPLAQSILAAAFSAVACGCTQEMYDQPRIEPLEASEFFQDGMSARPPIAGTVARGELWQDDPFFTGMVDGQAVTEIPSDPRTSEPFALTQEVLERGQERFNAFCSHCHGRTGLGDGMVVRRGFRQAPSLHEPRLREETPPGHFFEVITGGFKTMPAQGSRIAPEDRWAIVAYIGVLQQSQHLELADAPADIQRRFDEGPNSTEQEANQF